MVLRIYKNVPSAMRAMVVQANNNQYPQALLPQAGQNFATTNYPSTYRGPNPPDQRLIRDSSASTRPNPPNTVQQKGPYFSGKPPTGSGMVSTDGVADAQSNMPIETSGNVVRNSCMR
jgi:hypothetical protein